MDTDIIFPAIVTGIFSLLSVFLGAFIGSTLQGRANQNEVYTLLFERVFIPMNTYKALHGWTMDALIEEFERLMEIHYHLIPFPLIRSLEEVQFEKKYNNKSKYYHRCNDFCSLWSKYYDVYSFFLGFPCGNELKGDIRCFLQIKISRFLILLLSPVVFFLMIIDLLFQFKSPISFFVCAFMIVCGVVVAFSTVFYFVCEFMYRRSNDYNLLKIILGRSENYCNEWLARHR